MKKKTLYILLFSLVCTAHILGQLRSVHSYSQNDGLSPGLVNVIQSDSFGYLWIGCKNGLSRFNGRSFQNYSANLTDSTALPASEIFCLAPGKNGNMWIGTAKGLVLYNRDNNNFETWNSKKGLTMDVIKHIAIQNDSILWLGHWYGLDRINLNNFNIKNISPFGQKSNKNLNHFSPNHIQALKVSPYTNEVFASYSFSLSKYDELGDSLVQILSIKDKSNVLIKDFEWIDDHRIIILTNHSSQYYIFNLSNNHLEHFANSDRSWNRVIKNHKNELIILDSELGPLKWTDHLKEAISSKKKTDSKIEYKCIHADKSDNLWCGKIDEIEQWVIKSTELFEIDNNISFHTAYDLKQNIGVSLTYNMPYCWEYAAGKIKKLHYDVSDLHPQNIIFSNKRQLFISVNNTEMTLFHPSKLIKIKVKLDREIKAGGIKYIVEQNDNIFLTLDKSILKISAEGKVKKILDQSKDIFNILVENDTSIYYSSIGTLYHFDGSVSHPIYSNSELIRSRGLTITGDTSLWFTELYIGLVELNLKTHYPTFYGSDSGLTSQSLYSIRRKDGDLLIPGSFCFYNFDASTKKVKEVYQNNQTYRTNDIANDIIRTTDGYYLVTVDRGIILEPPKTHTETLHHLDIAYIQKSQGNKIFHLDSKLRFRHDQNDIFIKLDACYFGEKENLTFSYSTTKDPIVWVKVGNIDEFNFLNLQPNIYEISIKTEDTSGQTIIKESILTIEILPPFWETVWFRFLLLGVLATFTYSVYQWRIRNLKKKYELDKKLIQLENNALKSQMNPHFLFNSLNGIRTLVKLNENEKASSYINYLSKMLRDTLTYHKVPSISLLSELEMSENYLQLAKLRFGNKLNWKVNVADNVNISCYKVPPFILQPILENAIWHGLKHITTDGLITLSVRKDTQYLYLSIEDNGIGLEAVSKLQEAKVRTREHIGIKLVESRLIPIKGTFHLSTSVDHKGVKAEIKIAIDEKV